MPAHQLPRSWCGLDPLSPELNAVRIDPGNGRAQPERVAAKPETRAQVIQRRSFFLLLNNNIFIFINGNRGAGPRLSHQRKYRG
jgi:hypothetical protein